MPETEHVAVAAEVPSPGSPAPEPGGGTAAPHDEGRASKPRSGFARQKIKLQRVTELYENTLCDYERLLADHHNLERDYAKLEAAFNEVADLNTALAGELRQLKQQRPPVRYGAGLMGM
jgi:hypothetical protein